MQHGVAPPHVANSALRVKRPHAVRDAMFQRIGHAHFSVAETCGVERIKNVPAEVIKTQHAAADRVAVIFRWFKMLNVTRSILTCTRKCLRLVGERECSDADATRF